MRNETFARAGRVPASWTAVVLVLLATLLTACGGSDGRGDDTLAAPQPIRRCDGCLPGRLSGEVYLAGLQPGVLVRVHDAVGAWAESRTDRQGRFDVDVGTLVAPLLVQAEVPAGGRLWRVHAAVRRDEVGVEAVAVTPVTELIAADALGGHPADLLQAGRAEMQRLEAATGAAERRVAQLLWPVMDAAGVAAGTNLRTFAPSRDHALQAALASLQVTEADAGGVYAVRHLSQRPQDALRVAPGQAGGGQVLARPDADAIAAVAAATASLPQLHQRLEALAGLFAAGVPDAAALAPWLAAEFRHGGLDAAAYIDTVLRRQDAPARGGFSLAQMRFGPPLLLQVADGGRRLRVALQRTARAPHVASDDTFWVVQQADGAWQLQGDGDAAQARVRNVAALGPRVLDATAVRGLAGVNCSAAAGVLGDAARTRCLIEGGQEDVAAGGWLDLGSPDDRHFGGLAAYRSDAADALLRLADYATHSRLMGEASAQVKTYLMFELDARQADPRAVRATVTGPGLPAEGVVLHPPAREAGAPLLDHWTLDADGLQDWAAVETGLCAAAAADCAAANAQPSGTGSPYRFALHDAAGAVIQHIEASLPSAPMAAATLWAQRERWFARWDLRGHTADQPTLAQLLGRGSGGDALRLAQRWLPPQDPQTRSLYIDALWHRAALPPAAAQPMQTRRRWVIDSGGALDDTLPASGQHRTVWLSLLLQSGDALGNRYLHAVSPANPH